MHLLHYFHLIGNQQSVLNETHVYRWQTFCQHQLGTDYWVNVELYSTANDPETANDPQNGPQMILDRKWSLKSTANDPVKTWGMEWILWDWLQKRTDYIT